MRLSIGWQIPQLFNFVIKRLKGRKKLWLPENFFKFVIVRVALNGTTWHKYNKIVIYSRVVLLVLTQQYISSPLILWEGFFIATMLKSFF